MCVYQKFELATAEGINREETSVQASVKGTCIELECINEAGLAISFSEVQDPEMQDGGGRTFHITMNIPNNYGYEP